MATRVRASMLDDERYPIAVNPDGIPVPPVQATKPHPLQSPVSLLSQPSVNPHLKDARGPESVAQSPVSSMASSRLSSLLGSKQSQVSSVCYPVPQTTSRADPTMFKGEGAWDFPVVDSESLRKSEQSFWRQWSLMKVLFFGFLAFMTGMLIAIIVINNKKQSARSSKSSGNSAEALLNTTTQVVSDATSLTCSGLFLADGVTYTMQLYYQPVNTTNILYRMNLANSTWGRETFQKPANMSLTILPKAGSPLAATAATEPSGVVYLDIFYVTAMNTIAQASLTCAAGSADCTTVSNAVISKVAASAQTGLAAVNFNRPRDWRVYYHNENHNIVELDGRVPGVNTSTIYNGKTLPGSSLAALNVNRRENTVYIFFVDYDSKALHYTHFVRTWQIAKPVSSGAAPKWNPLSSLASSYAPWLDQIHLYYVGNNAAVYEYIGVNVTLTPHRGVPFLPPGTNVIWAQSINPSTEIATTAFRDQVRWWQYNSYGPDGLVEGALSNVTWVANRVE